MALSLEVREGESISLDDGGIVITVTQVRSHKVRLGIQAPQDVSIGRPYTPLRAPNPEGAPRLKPPRTQRV